MANFDENLIIELGKTPIQGANPCGTDVAESEEYIFVMGELAKLDRIEIGEPDWYRVEEACRGLLRSQAKDVELAVALGLALFQRSSYVGLAAVLGLLHGLVTHFWEGLYPERPRRRKTRMEFLTDRFTEGGWFSAHQPKPEDFDALDLCVSRIEALKAVLTEKMPDDPPDFGKFARAIKELAARRPKAAAGPEAATGEGSATTSGAAGATFSAGEVADRSGAVNAVFSAVTFLRKTDPTDPVPYALVRVIKWAKIALPTTDAAKYQIDPPEAAMVEALSHQFSKGLWENLLKNAEAAFRASDPLWLDLQRYVCAAMKGLGAPYEKAEQTITGLTAGLVRRLGEGTFELKFRNGLPLCGGETRLWIEAELAASGRGGRSAAAGAANGKLDEASQKAKQLAAGGKLKEALEELQAGLAGCTQRRDRFLWRLRIAQLCFDAQRLQLAGPLLEECHDEVQRFGIRDWEPALAVDAAQTLYRCRKSLMASEKAPPPEAVEKVRDSFAWLCQLDPLAALAAEPSGK
jgi:type VI secretion system protein VasJ